MSMNNTRSTKSLQPRLSNQRVADEKVQNLNKNHYENTADFDDGTKNLFPPIRESIDYENFIMPIKQHPIPKQESPLSKTPDSMDESWMSSAVNNAVMPFKNLNKSNSNSSVSPSNESLKNSGGISSGFGTQSYNDMLDYSTDDIVDEFVIENDDNDEVESEYEEDDAEMMRLQDEAEKLKNTKVNKQAPLPLPPQPKLNDIQKHINEFLSLIIAKEKPFNAKLTYLVKFRQDLEKNCTEASNADLNVLFTHVEQLLEQQTLFISELKNLLMEVLRNDLLTLLLKALSVFGNMLILSLKLYCEFLDNYPKAMVILNKFQSDSNKMNQIFNNIRQSNHHDINEHKNNNLNKIRKSFIECENEFFKNIYSNHELSNTAQIFSNDLLNHPLDLVKHSLSLKEECSYFIKMVKIQNKWTEFRGENELNSMIKQWFDCNKDYNDLKEEIFTKIDRILLPNHIRKNDDVVELTEKNDKKLRHLVLYSDCLICCAIKK